MAKVPFESLSSEERREALEVAANLSGRRGHILEKDTWVVYTLRALAESPFAGNLTLQRRYVIGEGVSGYSAVLEDLGRHI